jgi:hypothetical protein
MLPLRRPPTEDLCNERAFDLGFATAVIALGSSAVSTTPANAYSPPGYVYYHGYTYYYSPNYYSAYYCIYEYYYGQQYTYCRHHGGGGYSSGGGGSSY